MNTEAIVYLLRKTSLSLKDIGKLTPRQCNELLKELYYQESVGEWRNQYSLATILAAIYNTIPRKRGSRALGAGDFLKGSMPKRNEESLETIAKKKGIKIPSK